MRHNYRFTLFENDTPLSLNEINGNNLDAIENAIYTQIYTPAFEAYPEDDQAYINFLVKDELTGYYADYGILADADEQTMAGFIDKKTLIKLPRFDTRDWGTVHIMFTLL